MNTLPILGSNGQGATAESMSTLDLISPHDFPAALAMFIGLIALIFVAYKLGDWLWRKGRDAVRGMFARWDEEDEKHFQSIRAAHQKLHENDGRAY